MWKADEKVHRIFGDFVSFTGFKVKGTETRFLGCFFEELGVEIEDLAARQMLDPQVWIAGALFFSLESLGNRATKFLLFVDALSQGIFEVFRRFVDPMIFANWRKGLAHFEADYFSRGENQLCEFGVDFVFWV